LKSFLNEGGEAPEERTFRKTYEGKKGGQGEASRETVYMPWRLRSLSFAEREGGGKTTKRPLPCWQDDWENAGERDFLQDGVKDNQGVWNCKKLGLDQRGTDIWEAVCQGVDGGGNEE